LDIFDDIFDILRHLVGLQFFLGILKLDASKFLHAHTTHTSIIFPAVLLFLLPFEFFGGVP
jgi:hypothetical protein